MIVGQIMIIDNRLVTTPGGTIQFILDCDVMLEKGTSGGISAKPSSPFRQSSRWAGLRGRFVSTDSSTVAAKRVDLAFSV